MNRTKIYAVCFPIQQAQIGAWCWGSCGKGRGAIDLGPTAAIMCCEDDCPHLEKQLDAPVGDVEGHEVYVRKLLPVTP